MPECVVLTPFDDRSTGQSHDPGTRIEVDTAKVDRWMKQGLIRPVAPTQVEDWPWGLMQGCQLTAAPAPVGELALKRVVACLNVWDDLPMLRHTLPTWIDHVDHVIAVDGPYAWHGWYDAGVREPYSTDGTLEYLTALGPAKCTVFHHRDRFWADQLEKRNAYLTAAMPGDLLFVVDADEEVYGAEHLREAEGFDVGWVRVQYQHVYRRRYRQPRVFLWRPGLEYRGRHHWLYVGERLLTTHQYGGGGWDHKMLSVLVNNLPGERPAERQQLRAVQRRGQVRVETEQQALSPSDSRVGAREPLQIVQLALYDAGMVVYRLHTAINTTTPHSSIFGGYVEKNGFEAPMQYDVVRDQDTLRQAIREADVIHCHLSLHPLMQLGEPVKRVPVVMHHHGTMFRQAHEWRTKQDRAEAAVRIVSNLELLNYGDDLNYLPNPVPVAQYLRLAAAGRAARDQALSAGPMIVGHSPSKQHLKGTLQLRQAVRRLQRQGLDIKVDLIHDVSHGEALLRKARCDVCFDSFWLGMQCSGLEAGAMGQPVLAGTGDGIHDRYVEWVGQVPYTAVNSRDELQAGLEQLYIDREYRRCEGARVQAFVEEYHDYAAVALRYLEILDAGICWRQRLTV